MFNKFFFGENHAVYGIIWKNIVERGRLQMTIWRMRIACWIPKATHTHTQYVILIAVPLQQSFHERPSFCFIRTLPVLFVCHFFERSTYSVP
jgi:hypothetical protein